MLCMHCTVQLRTGHPKDQNKINKDLLWLNNKIVSICQCASVTVKPFKRKIIIFQQILIKSNVVSNGYITVNPVLSFNQTSLFLYIGTATGPASVRGICNRLWRGSERRGALRFPADRRRQQGLGTLPHRRHIGSHHHDGEAGPRKARPPQRELSCMWAGLFRRCRFAHFLWLVAWLWKSECLRSSAYHCGPGHGPASALWDHSAFAGRPAGHWW